MQIPREREKGVFVPSITLRSALMLVLTFAVGFLIGRVHIGQDIWPFGVAFVLAAFINSQSINPYLALGGVLAALATFVMSMENPAYNFAVVGLAAALMILATCLKLPMRPIVAIAAAGISYLACALAFKLMLLLSFLSSIIELAIAAMMIYVMNTVFKLLSERIRRRVLSDEEIISVVFIGLLAIMGLGDLGIAGVTLRAIAASYLCVCSAMVGGAAVGAAVGIAVALPCVIVGDEPLLMATLGLCSLIAGAANRLGKAGVVVGFLATHLFMTFTLNGGRFVAVSVIEAGIAAAGFLFTPKKALDFVGKYVDMNLLRIYEQGIHLERFKQITVGRLKEISNVFCNAAQVFKNSANKNGEQGISYMIGGIPESACANCMFFKGCWDESFAQTYHLMQRLYAKYDAGKMLSERDLGQAFLKRCIHPARVIDAAQTVFAAYNTNSKWESKIAESRAMVGEQLAGVSRVIDSLLEEVQVDVSFKADIEEDIRLALDGIGIAAREVCAEVLGGNMRITLRMRSCRGKGLCEGKVQRIISQVCGTPMRRTSSAPCSGKKYCTLEYEQARAFGLQTGIARMTKEGSPASGDAHSFDVLKDGRHMLLLCDGMGSGEKAARESSAAVSLMEDFYRANFDDKTILDAINKLLILSSSDEIFSTMDLCMVNLIDGTARITKIGAPHSYIFRAKGVQKLKAGSLPMGILDEFQPVVHDVKLEYGDVIVLFTDGIADLDTQESGLLDQIKEACELRNAQEIAQRILYAALAEYDGQAKDDMTVIVARVVRGGGQGLRLGA